MCIFISLVLAIWIFVIAAVLPPAGALVTLVALIKERAASHVQRLVAKAPPPTGVQAELRVECP